MAHLLMPACGLFKSTIGQDNMDNVRRSASREVNQSFHSQQSDRTNDVEIKKRPYFPPILLKLDVVDIAGGIQHLQESDGSGFTS